MVNRGWLLLFQTLLKVMLLLGNFKWRMLQLLRMDRLWNRPLFSTLLSGQPHPSLLLPILGRRLTDKMVHRCTRRLVHHLHGRMDLPRLRSPPTPTHSASP